MATLYSKGGKKVTIPHAIDVKDWLDEGYSYEDPTAKKETKGGDSLSEANTEGNTGSPDEPEQPPVGEVDKDEPEVLPPAEPSTPEVNDAEWFESVKGKLGSLGAEDVKRAADFVGVPYTNKRDTIAAIKDTLK